MSFSLLVGKTSCCSLKANADNVGITGTTEKVTNNGTVSLNGGTLGILIDGGKIALTGDVTSSADNLFGDITNDGKLTLTKGTLKKDIAESETGSVLIADLIRYGDFVETTLSNEDLYSLRNICRMRNYLGHIVFFP